MNKRQGHTYGKTFCIYKNGNTSLGMNIEGKIDGKWVFTRPDGSQFTKDYQGGRKSKIIKF